MRSIFRNADGVNDKGGTLLEQRSVIVIHGLNLKPEKMSQIERICAEQGAHPVLVVLDGHKESDTMFDYSNVDANQWVKEVQNALRVNRPVLGVVAYSLGALCYLCALAESGESLDLEPRFQILLAPAIGLRNYTNLLKPFLALRRFVVPSASHPCYRRHWGTPLGAYSALFQLLKRLESKVNHGFVLRNDTRLVMNPKDELVDLQRVEELLGQMTKKCHETILVESRNSKLKPQYKHLILDELSMGKHDFSRVSNVLEQAITAALSHEVQNEKQLQSGGQKEH